MLLQKIIEVNEKLAEIIYELLMMAAHGKLPTNWFPVNPVVNK